MIVSVSNNTDFSSAFQHFLISQYRGQPGPRGWRQDGDLKDDMELKGEKNVIAKTFSGGARRIGRLFVWQKYIVLLRRVCWRLRHLIMRYIITNNLE